METVELLAPAKDARTAIAAVKCGADAVYIGAERFGARQQAGNPIEEIQKVINFAHPFYAKVYVTLNTLLFDNELPIAEKMINQLYRIGIDGLIIQDVGLIELDLPPIPLIASTQMNNATIEKIKFLEDVGFSRVILARELTIEQIRQIRKATSIELECFIHGSLCIGASGQCYLSYALGGRSANRGQCAQPCRKSYTLKDKNGRSIIENRYLLSLKDLNLSDYLEQLIDAGVTAFKIEGRLKETPYVANTVGFYREKFDEIIQKKNLGRASSGKVYLNFKPDPQKTFNRVFTDYGICGKIERLGSIDTPKSTGEFVGTVDKVQNDYFTLKGNIELHNGDGICFFDKNKNLLGTKINKVEGQKVRPQKMSEIRTNMKIYRNNDHQFLRLLEKEPAERKILISIDLKESPKGFLLSGKDEDGNEAVYEIETEKKPAIKRENAQENIISQLKKIGNTIFECSEVRLDLEDIYFLPVSVLNNAKRQLVEKMIEAREKNYPRKIGGVIENFAIYPEKHLTYLGNCLNEKACDFYRRHGVETIEPAAESGLDMKGKLVMVTKYCLKKELGLCKDRRQGACAEPLILEDEDGRQLRIEFCCGRCGMEIRNS